MLNIVNISLENSNPYADAVQAALSPLGLDNLLKRQRRIIIKPNLVLGVGPPVTTDVRCVEAVARFCLSKTGAEVVVAEGSGGADTLECYNKLGYADMAGRLGLKLVDLDREPWERQEHPGACLYKTFPLPRILAGSFIISVPVLKEHTITDVSLSLKNMIGICPPGEFSGYLAYKKSRVHKDDVDRAIVDINLHCPVNLAVIDGALGMRGSHLGGPVMKPPAAIIIAGTDPVAVDAAGAGKLGLDWQKIRHLRLAHGLLGSAEQVCGEE